MAQTLRVGAAQTYTTLDAAMVAMGSITGTGANFILVDAGFEVTADVDTTGKLTSAGGAGDVDTCIIRGDGGRFIITSAGVADIGILINAEGVYFEEFDLTHASAGTMMVSYKPNSGFRNYKATSTILSSHGFYGSSLVNQVIEGGEHFGLLNVTARYLSKVSRLTSLGQDYGLQDVTLAEDCAVFNSTYSADYVNVLSSVTSASSDTSGSIGFQNLVATTEFVSPSSSSELSISSSLIGAGTVGFNIGYDQVTGYIERPILTGLSMSNIATTAATVNITTDVADGNLYIVVSESGVTPTESQMLALTDSTDTTGIFSSNTQVVGLTIARDVTGLTLFTSYYTHILQKRASGGNSVVSTSQKFDTLDIARPIPTNISTISHTGLVTIDGSGFLATEGTLNIGVTPQTDIVSWSDSEITFNPTIQNLQYANYNLKITDNLAVESRPLEVTVVPPTGKAYVNVNSTLGDVQSIDFGMVDQSVVGDQLEYDIDTSQGGASNVSVFNNLVFQITNGGVGQHTFTYKRHHAGVWESELLAVIN